MNVLEEVVSRAYCGLVKPMLAHIVLNMETGFVPGRTIIKNIILIDDLVHWCTTHCRDAM